MTKPDMEELIEIACSLVESMPKENNQYNRGVIDMLATAIFPEISDDRASWLITKLIDAR